MAIAQSFWRNKVNTSYLKLRALLWQFKFKNVKNGLKRNKKKINKYWELAFLLNFYCLLNFFPIFFNQFLSVRHDFLRTSLRINRPPLWYPLYWILGDMVVMLVVVLLFPTYNGLCPITFISNKELQRKNNVKMWKIVSLGGNSPSSLDFTWDWKYASFLSKNRKVMQYDYILFISGWIHDPAYHMYKISVRLE